MKIKGQSTGVKPCNSTTKRCRLTDRSRGGGKNKPELGNLYRVGEKKGCLSQAERKKGEAGWGEFPRGKKFKGPSEGRSGESGGVFFKTRPIARARKDSAEFKRKKGKLVTQGPVTPQKTNLGGNSCTGKY